MKTKVGTGTFGAQVVVGTAMGLVVTIAGCGGGNDDAAQSSSVSIADAAARCSALAGTTVPVSAFALATSGATLAAASVVPADAASGTGEYCKVTGQVNAVQTADPPIKFQVNLPSQWNTKSLQFGGGGFNGTVVTADGNVSNAPTSTGHSRAPASWYSRPVARSWR